MKPVLRADVTKAGGDKTYAKAVATPPAVPPAAPVLSVLTTPLPHSSSSSTPASRSSDYSNNDSITDSLASYGGLLEAAVASVKDAINTVYPSSSSSSVATSPSAGGCLPLHSIPPIPVSIT